jgi:hypothetical protein
MFMARLSQEKMEKQAQPKKERVNTLGVATPDAGSLEELTMQKFKLQESNVALRVLLKKRDEDKVEIEEKMIYNIKELVKPYIEK